jgi:hypothetical protein
MIFSISYLDVRLTKSSSAIYPLWFLKILLVALAASNFHEEDILSA